jgi:hypothetical protein
MSTCNMALAAGCALLASACSFGSFQTGHTQAPGTVSALAGGTFVSNRMDDTAGRGGVTNSGAQLGARIGLTQRMDLGFGTFLGTGLKSDLKLNLLDPHAKLALSPRLGAGYRLGRKTSMLEAGAVTSYRVSPHFEPYFGATFANHWIQREPPAGEPLPPNVVGRSGTGDGLLQLNLGVEVPLSRHIALLAEYGHWFPLSDDPGDFYRFVPTNIAGLALRFGHVAP